MTDNMPLATSEMDDLPISNIPEAKLAKLTEKAWLPYIKLAAGKKVEAGEIKPGSFLLVKDKATEIVISPGFEILVIAARPLAVHNTPTSVERFYDMESAGYKNVEKLSTIPNHTGDWHGTEYLWYMRAMRQWCTFHASSATAKSRSEVLTDILKQWSLARRNKKLAIDLATKNNDPAALAAAQAIVVPNPQAKIGSDLVFYKKHNSHKWAANFAPVTTPFSEVPSFEEIREQSEKFRNPPTQVKETVQAAADAGESRG